MRNPKYYTKEILNVILPKYCSGKLVDVGCGRGKYKKRFLKYCDTYTGVDNCSSEYQFLNEKDSANPDVVASVLEMPFPENEFDTAICTEVIEHVPNPFVLVAEIARVLKPGGHLILSSGWIAAYHQEPKDYWRFSVDGYSALAEANGMELIDDYSKGGLFTVMLYLIYRNIDLNSTRLKRIKARMGRLIKFFDLVAEQLDKLFKTRDTVGHLVIARKK
jgi:ubiquinone/menaquinone biosynthesis C-methylase UbiE